MHEYTIAEWGSIHEKLEHVFTRTGGICMLDSTFNRRHYHSLIKSSQHVPDTYNYDVIQKACQATFSPSTL